MFVVPCEATKGSVWKGKEIKATNDVNRSRILKCCFI